MKQRLVIATITIVMSAAVVSAQDSTVHLSEKLSSKYIAAAKDKAGGIAGRLDKESQKILSQFKKQEEKIIRKLSKIDSARASELAAAAKAKYDALEAKLRNPGKLTKYVPGLDSMSTTLNFLGSNSELLSQAKEVKDKVGSALSKVDELKAQLQKTEDIRVFLKERKQYLKEQLEKFGFAKELKKVNKQAYYYAQQLQEFKAILNDPKKIEKKALEVLSKTKIWKEFFKKNSMLTSLFPMPGGSEGGISQTGFAGLQTRVQVTTFLQQSGISGPNNSSSGQLQQNIQYVQSQVNQLRNKLSQFTGGNSEDFEIPDFKPNTQKAKSFFKRLEYGTNIQSQKSRNFLPSITDIGVSLGYKLNDKGTIGVGTSYKVGLGSSWNNIRLTSQGIGIRSFVDWSIKKSWLISGGYEQNYLASFNRIDQLKQFDAWQRSGLIGMSKKVSLKSKFLKSTKVQLLWDFLAGHQKPRSQPILLRIGYSFK